jgi:signal peptidase I
VSEPTPIPDASPADGLSVPVRSSHGTKRQLLTALFSAVVPGVGHLFLGQRRKGIALLLIFAAILIGFWPLRFLRFYVGFVLLYSAWIALYIYAACSAQLARNLPESARPSKWWLVAFLPVTIVSLSLLGQVVTRASGFRSFTVPSTSMERTITRGDHIVADMRYYSSLRRPERRETIIFFKDHTFFIKRVIAIRGDSIEGQNNMIFVNGEKQDEPYVEHRWRAAELNWMINFGPVYIPNGKYFVMGDNRDVSLDSRSAEFGLIDDSAIVGKPLYIFRSDREGRSVR